MLRAAMPRERGYTALRLDDRCATLLLILMMLMLARATLALRALRAGGYERYVADSARYIITADAP